MDNLIEGLLGLDDSNFNTHKTKLVEIPRLSKALGVPFMIGIKSLSPERIYELQDKSIDNTGGVSMIKFYRGACNVCSEAITSPDFDDVKLKKKFNLHEKALKLEVIKAVLKVPEINLINSEVMAISGFDEASEVVNELKND